MGAIGYVVATVYNGSDGVLAIIGLVGLSMLFGLVRLAQRYVLYLVKIGHVRASSGRSRRKHAGA